MEGISLPHDHGQTMEQELEHMPSTENFQTVADVFKQLSEAASASSGCCAIVRSASSISLPWCI